MQICLLGNFGSQRINDHEPPALALSCPYLANEMKVGDGGVVAPHNVERSVGSGLGPDAPPPRGYSYRLIAAPHDVTERNIAGATRFNDAPVIELDGEIA